MYQQSQPPTLMVVTFNVGELQLILNIKSLHPLGKTGIFTHTQNDKESFHW